MKNKTALNNQALKILSTKLKSYSQQLENIKLLNHNEILSAEISTAIKKEKLTKKYLEELLTTALTNNVYLKNANNLLTEIFSETNKCLEVLKIIKTTPNKHKPSKVYLSCWAIFLELRNQNPNNLKNPSFNLFQKTVQAKKIAVEMDTINKYWKEFRKKIDSGLFLLENIQK